ncbi:MAG: RnfABCDGE type electron transport complex subunit D [Gammaproteobacteria bacterium]|nr:RnfABCDGE type electron transport complex subunit D [Gammaproteobacteria bacterium]
MTEAAFISSPHRHGGATITAVMLRVALALLPGILLYAWYFGIGILIQCVLAACFALALEALLLKLRGRPVGLFLRDGSAVVTGLLLALCIPPTTPWWMVLTGIIFAIAAAKHAFGGIGYNPFNPAMAGFVFVLLCFPREMNSWPAAPGTLETGLGLGDSLRAIFLPGREMVDATSGATALGYMKSRLGLMGMISEIRADPVFGTFGGRGWEWISAGFLAGGIALLVMGIVKWHIPAAMLIALTTVSTGFHLYDADVYASPIFHLFGGATMLGAFFVATDPVSASTTPRGRLIYGALIGTLTYVIRVWGAYPDGIAFAVLLGNAAAPLIDHHTRPRVLGESGSGA